MNFMSKMINFKIGIYALLALIAMAFISCENLDEDYSYNELELHISKSEIYASYTKPIELEVELMYSVKEDEIITLSVIGNEFDKVVEPVTDSDSNSESNSESNSNLGEGSNNQNTKGEGSDEQGETVRTEKCEVLKIEDVQFLIKKGERTAKTVITSNNNYTDLDPANVSIVYESSTIQNLMVKQSNSSVHILVKAVPVVKLNDVQKTLIKEYKAATGVDISRLIGRLKVKTHIEYNERDQTEFFKGKTCYDYEGESVLTISETASRNHFFIKMVDNPMGMTAWLEQVFLRVTYNDKEFFNNPLIAASTLCKMSGYDVDNPGDDIFKASLDSVEVNYKQMKDGVTDLKYIREINSRYDESIENLPIRYDFPPQKRLEQMAAEGKEITVQENDGPCNYPLSLYLYTYRVTLDPALHLEQSDLSRDDWIDNTDYVQPTLWMPYTSKIDFEKGIMTFDFPWDFADRCNGYCKVHVEYYLNDSEL